MPYAKPLPNATAHDQELVTLFWARRQPRTSATMPFHKVIQHHINIPKAMIATR